MRSRPVLLVLFALLAAVAAGAPAVAGTVPRPSREASEAAWAWPAEPVRIVALFDAPAHAFGAGHRGIDLAAPDGAAVRAPADGVVAFAGVVVDRTVVTIDHGDGHVTSIEPVTALVARGAHVRAGEVIARASHGGHVAAGSIHVGVRLHGAYVDPLDLFGALPRAVLLPCC